MNIIGWIGSLLLAICGLPLCIEALRRKKMRVNIWFLSAWFFGEVLCLFYVWGDWPLTTNYLCNILFLLPVWWYGPIRRWRRK